LTGWWHDTLLAGPVCITGTGQTQPQYFSGWTVTDYRTDRRWVVRPPQYADDDVTWHTW